MMLLTNLSSKDRIIRASIGLVMATMSYHNIAVSGMYDIAFGLVGIGLMVTALLAHCPIYKALNFSTYKK